MWLLAAFCCSRVHITALPGVILVSGVPVVMNRFVAAGGPMPRPGVGACVPLAAGDWACAPGASVTHPAPAAITAAVTKIIRFIETPVRRECSQRPEGAALPNVR